jgi:hypothetical protein
MAIALAPNRVVAVAKGIVGMRMFAVLALDLSQLVDGSASLN